MDGKCRNYNVDIGTWLPIIQRVRQIWLIPCSIEVIGLLLRRTLLFNNPFLGEKMKDPLHSWWYKRNLKSYFSGVSYGSPSGPMTWWLCVLCLFFLLPFSITAQEGNNPFDQVQTEENNSQNQVPANPFDLIHRSDSRAEGYNPFDVVKTNEQNMDRLEQLSPRQIIKKTQNSVQDNFNFILFSSILILFTFLFTAYRSNLSQIYRGFLNENILKLLHREQTGIVKAPYLIWYLFAIISISAFIIQIAKHFYPLILDGLWANYGRILLGMMVILFIKHLGMIILGNVFPLQKEMGIYSFTFILTTIILGLVLVPINLIIAFGPSISYGFFIYLGLFLVVLAYAYGYMRILFITSRKWARYLFHFFIYLCTVEIAPVIVLLKLIMY